MGVKLKKEWLATLDGRTRHSHAVLDGEQVAQDKAFFNGCRFPGDPKGAPGEIYNCRCTLTAVVEGADTSDAKRRARNAEIGQNETASGMSYQEWTAWKQKEAVREESKNLYDSAVVSPLVKTSGYRNLFNNLDENVKVQRKAYQASRAMLEHRSGTKFEDLTFIDSVTGKTMSRTNYNVESEVMPSLRMRKMVTNAAPRTIIAIHNHPGNSVPSFSDLNTAYKRGYKYGVIACHNGTVMKYEVTGELERTYVDALLDSVQRHIYNSNKEDLEAGLQQLRRANVILEVFV